MLKWLLIALLISTTFSKNCIVICTSPLALLLNKDSLLYRKKTSNQFKTLTNETNVDGNPVASYTSSITSLLHKNSIINRKRIFNHVAFFNNDT